MQLKSNMNKAKLSQCQSKNPSFERHFTLGSLCCQFISAEIFIPINRYIFCTQAQQIVWQEHSNAHPSDRANQPHSCINTRLNYHYSALPKLFSKINNHTRRFLLLLLCQTLTTYHYFSWSLSSIFILSAVYHKLWSSTALKHNMLSKS